MSNYKYKDPSDSIGVENWFSNSSYGGIGANVSTANGVDHLMLQRDAIDKWLKIIKIQNYE